MSDKTKTDAGSQVVNPDTLPARKAGWFRTWRRFMKWYLSCCLLLGTPVLWAYGIMAYALHDGSLIVLNVQIKDLPSLLLLVFTGPLAITIISLALWAFLILPLQIFWRGGRWAYQATLAGTRHSSGPAASA